MLRPTCKHIILGLLLISLVSVVIFYFHDGPLSEDEKKRSSLQANEDYSRCPDRGHYWDGSRCLPCTYCTDDELKYEPGFISAECRDENSDIERGCSIGPGPPKYCAFRKNAPSPDIPSKYIYPCIDITTTPNISKQSDAPESTSQPPTPRIPSQPPPPGTTSQPPTPEHVSQPPPSEHVSNSSTAVSIIQQPITPGTPNTNHKKNKKKQRNYIIVGIAAVVALVGLFIVAGRIYRWRKNKEGTYSHINNSTTVDGAVDSERIDEEDTRSHRGEYTGGSDAKLTNENDEPQIDALVGKSVDSGINIINMSRTNSVSKNEFQMNRFDNDQNQMPGGNDTDIEDSGNEQDGGTQNVSSSPSNSCSSKGKGTPCLNSDILQQHSTEIAELKNKTEKLAEIGQRVMSQLEQSPYSWKVGKNEQKLFCFSVNKRLKCLIACQKTVHCLDNPCRCTITITCLQTECTVLTIQLDKTPCGYSTVELSPGMYRVQIHIQTAKGSTDIDLEDTVCINGTICDMTLEELRNKVNLMNMIIKCEPDPIFMRMFSDVLGVGSFYLRWISVYKDPDHCILLNKIMKKGWDEPVAVLFYTANTNRPHKAKTTSLHKPTTMSRGFVFLNITRPYQDDPIPMRTVRDLCGSKNTYIVLRRSPMRTGAQFLFG